MEKNSGFRLRGYKFTFSLLFVGILALSFQAALWAAVSEPAGHRSRP